MLKIVYHTKFKKDYKMMVKRGYDTTELFKVIDLLANQETLPEKYKDHKLTGNYVGFKECHINPDWLLIYKVEEDKLILNLVRTGSHSDLF